MKVAVCSDLHLEFGGIELENPGDVEVLILSGDKDFAQLQKYSFVRQYNPVLKKFIKLTPKEVKEFLNFQKELYEEAKALKSGIR